MFHHNSKHVVDPAVLQIKESAVEFFSYFESGYIT